jgi:hypothetical protein
MKSEKQTKTKHVTIELDDDDPVCRKLLHYAEKHGISPDEALQRLVEKRLNEWAAEMGFSGYPWDDSETSD